LLLILELIIGIANVYFHQNTTALFGMELEGLTKVLIYLISLPISFFGRDLPFYHTEISIAVSLTILNLLLQTFIISRIYIAIKK
jgi:hypothetical protein